MRHLVLIILILIPLCLAGQEQEETAIRILFQGVVFDSETLEPLPNSQLSVSSMFKSVSQDNGSFAVYVNVRDTVLFTRLGYRPASVVISDTLIGKQYLAGIFMNSDTLSIAEVVIVPRISSLRSEIMNPRMNTRPEIENAKNNVAISGYQGRTTTGNLGDPASNYEMLRREQKTAAFERGGIPSDKILGLNPFMVLPAAYLLLRGMPEKPQPLKPDVSDYELEQIRQNFLMMRK